MNGQDKALGLEIDGIASQGGASMNGKTVQYRTRTWHVEVIYSTLIAFLGQLLGVGAKSVQKRHRPLTFCRFRSVVDSQYRQATRCAIGHALHSDIHRRLYRDQHEAGLGRHASTAFQEVAHSNRTLPFEGTLPWHRSVTPTTPWKTIRSNINQLAIRSQHQCTLRAPQVFALV